MRFGALAIALVGLGGCASAGSGGTVAPRSATGPRVDMQAERLGLLAADSATATAAASGIGEGIVSRMADDAFYLQQGQPLVRGRAAVQALFARNPAFGAMRFQWRPVRVDVSADGSLGYTWGYGTTTSPTADGAAASAPAGYAIAWRRTDRGWVIAAFVRNAARVALTAAPAGFESPTYSSYREFPDADMAKDRAAIERADTEFSDYSNVHGLGDAFAKYAAPDGALLLGAFGPDSIRKALSGGPADMRARWRPVNAEVAASGDFGVTVGTAVFTFTDDGKPASSYSKYLTIWKRQPNGEWKWVFDGGNSSPAP